MAILEGVCRKGAGVYDQDVQIRKGTYLYFQGMEMGYGKLANKREKRK